MTMYNTTQLQTISKNAAPNGVMPNALKKLIYDSEAVEAAKSKAKTPEPTTTVVQDVENQTQGMQEEQQAKQLALTVPPQVLQEAAQMAMQMQAPQGAPGPTAPQGIASLPPQGMPQGMPPQQVASVDQGVGGLPDTGIDERSFAGGGIVAFSGATDGSVVGAGERDYTDYVNPGANVTPNYIEEFLSRAAGMTEEEKQAYRKNDAFLRRVEPTAASKVPPESRVVRAGGNDFNQQLGGINALPTELGTRALTTPTTTITFEPEALTTPTTTTTFEPGEALTTPTTTTTFEPEEAQERSISHKQNLVTSVSRRAGKVLQHYQKQRQYQEQHRQHHKEKYQKRYGTIIHLRCGIQKQMTCVSTTHTKKERQRGSVT